MAESHRSMGDTVYFWHRWRTNLNSTGKGSYRFFLLFAPKSVRLHSKSHRRSMKCQNFLRVWHFFRADQSKNHPVHVIPFLKALWPRKIVAMKEWCQEFIESRQELLIHPARKLGPDLTLPQCLIPSANKMSDGENVVMTWTRDLVPTPPDSQVLYLTLQDDRLWVVYIL